MGRRLGDGIGAGGDGIGAGIDVWAILATLGVANRVEAAAAAWRGGLVDQPGHRHPHPLASVTATRPAVTADPSP